MIGSESTPKWAICCKTCQKLIIGNCLIVCPTKIMARPISVKRLNVKKKGAHQEGAKASLEKPLPTDDKDASKEEGASQDLGGDRESLT